MLFLEKKGRGDKGKEEAKGGQEKTEERRAEEERRGSLECDPTN